MPRPHLCQLVVLNAALPPPRLARPFLLPGAQPMLIVLKVDGQVEGPWSSVFIPLWMFTGAIALGGSALCCCAPLDTMGMLLCSVGTFR